MERARQINGRCRKSGISVQRLARVLRGLQVLLLVPSFWERRFGGLLDSVH